MAASRVDRPSWVQLREIAGSMVERAHAPYSGFPVGAAATTTDGRVLTGCNVESASYGLTLCAECGILSALHAGGGGRLACLVCVNGNGVVLTPCGRCRQLLWEHGGPELELLTPSGVRRIGDLLPDAFDDRDLTELR